MIEVGARYFCGNSHSHYKAGPQSPAPGGGGGGWRPSPAALEAVPGLCLWPLRDVPLVQKLPCVVVNLLFS